MTARLCVGNLPSTTTRAELEAKFGQYGRVVSAEVSTNAATPRTTRTGYVEMESSEQAQAAIDRLNMTQYDDVVISVSRFRLKHSA